MRDSPAETATSLRLVIFVLCFFIPLTSAPGSLLQKGSNSATTPLPANDLFRLVSPSVFIVETLDKAGSVIALGSGVAVSADEVVTNIHVVEDGASWKIKQGDKSWSAIVTNADGEHDLCKLKVDQLKAKPVTIRASSTLEVGEKVYAVGAPEGLELTLSDGLVSGIRNFGTTRIIQTTAAISKGSSGGGLFDGSGQLVGITTFFVKEGQNLNFALPAELIASLNSQKFEGPPIGPQDPLFQALVWTLAGHEFLSQQKSDQALSAFEKAIRVQPDFADAWAGLALAYEDLKKNPEVAKSWEEAVRLKPNVAVYWYSLGLIYQKLLLFDEAIHAHEQAVALKPNYCEAWMRLGSVYWLKKKQAKVIDIYKKLKTLSCDQAEEFFRLFVLPH